jgi:mannitol/fructose-specific phosphotransferase system IIA component (Ntr-type)
VAIPHAAPQNVLKSKVFILTLNRGIVWDNKRVNYILLICISKDEKKLVKGVITDIHKLVKSEENVKFFFNKTRPEEIYRKILGG